MRVTVYIYTYIIFSDKFIVSGGVFYHSTTIFSQKLLYSRKSFIIDIEHFNDTAKFGPLTQQVIIINHYTIYIINKYILEIYI